MQIYYIKFIFLDAEFLKSQQKWNSYNEIDIAYLHIKDIEIAVVNKSK